jgi:hypothetical protein
VILLHRQLIALPDRVLRLVDGMDLGRAATFRGQTFRIVANNTNFEYGLTSSNVLLELISSVQTLFYVHDAAGDICSHDNLCSLCVQVYARKQLLPIESS